MIVRHYFTESIFTVNNLLIRFQSAKDQQQVCENSLQEILNQLGGTDINKELSISN